MCLEGKSQNIDARFKDDSIAQTSDGTLKEVRTHNVTIAPLRGHETKRHCALCGVLWSTVEYRCIGGKAKVECSPKGKPCASIAAPRLTGY